MAGIGVAAAAEASARLSNIPTLVLTCRTAFLELNAGAAKSTKYGDLSARLADEKGRFSLWTTNIGAHRSGKSSLDFRLRDSSHLQLQVVKLLRKLADNLAEADEILSGKRVPWDELPSDDSDSESDSDSDAAFPPPSEATEIGQIMNSITNTLTLLLRLSASIRNPTQHDRWLNSKSIDTSAFEHWDIEHVRAKFPQTDELRAERLGRGISRRRQFFNYRKQHRERLAQGFEPAEPTATESQKPAPTIVQSTVASSIPEMAKMPTSNAPLEDDEQSDIAFTATSFATSVAQGSKLTVPLLPCGTEYDKPFECPFCCSIVEMEDRRAWKKHVFADLAPYMCLSGECVMENQHFPSRHSWMQHEFNTHWTTLVCVFGCPNSFSSKQTLRDHLIQHHQESVVGRVEAVLATCEKPKPRDTPKACLLCASTLPNFESYGKHTAKHLQELALFSLPTLDNEADDGSESAETDEEVHGDLSAADDGSRKSGADDIPPFEPRAPSPSKLSNASSESLGIPLQRSATDVEKYAAIIDDILAQSDPSATSDTSHQAVYESLQAKLGYDISHNAKAILRLILRVKVARTIKFSKMRPSQLDAAPLNPTDPPTIVLVDVDNEPPSNISGGPEKCPVQTCEYHVKGFARKRDRDIHVPIQHYKGPMMCPFCTDAEGGALRRFDYLSSLMIHLESEHPRVQMEESICPMCGLWNIHYDQHLHGCMLRAVEHGYASGWPNSTYTMEELTKLMVHEFSKPSGAPVSSDKRSEIQSSGKVELSQPLNTDAPLGSLGEPAASGDPSKQRLVEWLNEGDDEASRQWAVQHTEEAHVQHLNNKTEAMVDVAVAHEYAKEDAERKAATAAKSAEEKAKHEFEMEGARKKLEQLDRQAEVDRVGDKARFYSADERYWQLTDETGWWDEGERSIQLEIRELDEEIDKKKYELRRLKDRIDAEEERAQQESKEKERETRLKVEQLKQEQGRQATDLLRDKERKRTLAENAEQVYRIKLELEAKEAATAAKAAEEEVAKRRLDDIIQPPIRFTDAIGRKFNFPWHLCKSWKGMETLINQAFLDFDVIDKHVHEGHYDLLGPDGEIILPEVWESVVKPDWAIIMHMWLGPPKLKSDEELSRHEELERNEELETKEELENDEEALRLEARVAREHEERREQGHLVFEHDRGTVLKRQAAQSGRSDFAFDMDDVVDENPEPFDEEQFDFDNCIFTQALDSEIITAPTPPQHAEETRIQKPYNDAASRTAMGIVGERELQPRTPQETQRNQEISELQMPGATWVADAEARATEAREAAVEAIVEAEHQLQRLASLEKAPRGEEILGLKDALRQQAVPHAKEPHGHHLDEAAARSNEQAVAQARQAAADAAVRAQEEATARARRLDDLKAPAEEHRRRAEADERRVWLEREVRALEIIRQVEAQRMTLPPTATTPLQIAAPQRSPAQGLGGNPLANEEGSGSLGESVLQRERDVASAPSDNRDQEEATSWIPQAATDGKFKPSLGDSVLLHQMAPDHPDVAARAGSKTIYVESDDGDDVNEEAESYYFNTLPGDIRRQPIIGKAERGPSAERLLEPAAKLRTQHESADACADARATEDHHDYDRDRSRTPPPNRREEIRRLQREHEEAVAHANEQSVAQTGASARAQKETASRAHPLDDLETQAARQRAEDSHTDVGYDTDDDILAKGACYHCMITKRRCIINDGASQCVQCQVLKRECNLGQGGAAAKKREIRAQKKTRKRRGEAKYRTARELRREEREQERDSVAERDEGRDTDYGTLAEMMTDPTLLQTHAEPQHVLGTAAYAPVALPPVANGSFANGYSPTLGSALEDDESTIKCFCGYSDDDGNTVFCELCRTWQHILCYYPGSQVPEVHECVQCHPRPYDARSAAERQRQFVHTAAKKEEMRRLDEQTRRDYERAHAAREEIRRLQREHEEAVAHAKTIKCFCGYSDDDGNTVFCELCRTWQHILCHYPGSQVPEVHECVQCHPRPYDARSAAERQRQFVHTAAKKEEMRRLDEQTRRDYERAHAAREEIRRLQREHEEAVAHAKTIKCFCGYSDDDGNTVFCELCRTWQHILCHYPGSQVPEVHECVQCRPRPYDARSAAERQRQFAHCSRFG
ncbi:hypothetical protein EJ06DRAFT_434184 [Trichodelitschia bisporula]|uniref:C2H2-type domain-containing protein n=1 Tax=Trichodelitschia bisporula TaxID=703511 RepID=A0A6G1HXI2_9PEZI|nr:hypothetical protein EJ06DRAFT_434184 [Trichodelitschia bisporula]